VRIDPAARVRLPWSSRCQTW